MNTDHRAFNVIEEPIIRVEHRSSARERLTLPQTLAALARDQVETWPALRPHQAPAWHAFLVQIAAMGLETLGRTQAPSDEAGWSETLRALTQEWPNDEPWCLVTPPGSPALLQAPAPERDPKEYEKQFKQEVLTPDALDMLVTTKNHELKAERMRDAAPDDWLFALVSLQTQGGYSGPRLYGIARMNKGLGNRSYVSLRPSGASAGAAFTRDLDAVVGGRKALRNAGEARGVGTEEAIALLWTVGWREGESMPLSRLHPLCVEICRRVRLERREEKLVARRAHSGRARVDAEHAHGDLADPWTPIQRSDAPRALSMTSEGLTYQRMTELMFGSTKRSWQLPMLARAGGRESTSRLEIVGAGIARGQGRTEGFHRRIVDIPPKAAALVESGDEDTATRARERVRQAGDVQGKCLRAALIVLVQKGTAEPQWKKPTNTSLTKPWIDQFEREVDQAFFPELWQSLDMSDDDASHAWSRTLARIARETLEAAAEAAPRAGERRVMAHARASNMLESALHKQLGGAHREKEKERWQETATNLSGEPKDDGSQEWRHDSRTPSARREITPP